MGRQPVTVTILAGGRRRWLGQDKSWIVLDGQTLVERVVRRVLTVIGEIIISAPTPQRFASLAHRDRRFVSRDSHREQFHSTGEGKES